jgi:hypothetical protein
VSRGFIQIRRGLQDHLFSGTLSTFDLGVYLILHLQADFGTGIWLGSAPRLMATAPRGTSLRNMQRALLRLAEIGFIKTFHKRGVRGNYRVLINKYEPRSGALTGMRLNAEKTLDWRRPVFEPCGEAVAENGDEDDAETDTEAAPYLEEEVEQQQEENQKIGSTSPASQAPTSQRFFEIWNQNRGQLAEAKALGKGRLAKCRLRARDVGESRFLEAVRKAAATPFCLGLNDRGWKADFDWLIANDTNATKVLEGRYDGQPQEPVWRQKQKLEEQQKAESVARFAEDGN